MTRSFGLSFLFITALASLSSTPANAGVALWASHSFEKAPNQGCPKELAEFLNNLTNETKPLSTSQNWNIIAAGIDLATSKTQLNYVLEREPDQIFVLSANQNEAHIRFQSGHSYRSWRLHFDTCEVTEVSLLNATEAAPPEEESFDADRFYDSDLTALVSSNSNGVIFMWSPHMPLSVASLQNVREACSRLNLPLTLLVDKDADPAVLDEAIRKSPFLQNHVRKNTSNILIRGGARKHYPNLLTYQNGRLLKASLSGAKSETQYTDFLNLTFPK